MWIFIIMTETKLKPQSLELRSHTYSIANSIDVDTGDIIVTLTINETGVFDVDFKVAYNNGRSNATGVRFVRFRLYKNSTSNDPLCSSMSQVLNAESSTDYSQAVAKAKNVSITSGDTLILQAGVSTDSRVETYNDTPGSFSYIHIQEVPPEKTMNVTAA